MWLTLLHMMSNTSLSAFSVVSPPNGAANPFRPVRETTRTAEANAPGTARSPYATDATRNAGPPPNTLPLTLPDFPANQVPPRGSLLNLSV